METELSAYWRDGDDRWYSRENGSQASVGKIRHADGQAIVRASESTSRCSRRAGTTLAGWTGSTRPGTRKDRLLGITQHKGGGGLCRIESSNERRWAVNQHLGCR